MVDAATVPTPSRRGRQHVVSLTFLVTSRGAPPGMITMQDLSRALPLSASVPQGLEEVGREHISTTPRDILVLLSTAGPSNIPPPFLSPPLFFLVADACRTKGRSSPLLVRLLPAWRRPQQANLRVSVNSGTRLTVLAPPSSQVALDPISVWLRTETCKSATERGRQSRHISSGLERDRKTQLARGTSSGQRSKEPMDLQSEPASPQGKVSTHGTAFPGCARLSNQI
ncbi:hypothetical protein CMUS01_00670 [Colletotrichum musicola]|uniref:Uncharacterized protein n=1 Tax=Colletotrichum musicola TaxID=2175873 RepID=A0A8H6U8T8_9PEZI|nr:hypothetical protein CMUS01_00670 [Colletotrichum musicola]